MRGTAGQQKGDATHQSTELLTARWSQEALLMEAVRSSSKVSSEEVKRLLRAGVDVNYQASASGYSALHMAASANNVEAVQLLLLAGGATELLDENGRTPLMHAARRGHQASCLALLESGADLGRADGDGKAPYNLCSCPSLKRQLVLHAKRQIAAKQRLAWVRCWAPCRQLCWERSADGHRQPVMASQSLPLFLGELPLELTAKIAGHVIGALERLCEPLPFIRRCFQQEHRCWDGGDSARAPQTAASADRRVGRVRSAGAVFPDVSLAQEQRLGNNWVAAEAERRAVGALELICRHAAAAAEPGSRLWGGREVVADRVDWGAADAAEAVALLEVAAARTRSESVPLFCARLAEVRLAQREYAAALRAADRALAATVAGTPPAAGGEWGVECHELRGRALLGLG
eukprot:SAG22_NODE_4016_length_1420_cov_3.286147_1_plen_404_part_10